MRKTTAKAELQNQQVPYGLLSSAILTMWLRNKITNRWRVSIQRHFPQADQPLCSSSQIQPNALLTSPGTSMGLRPKPSSTVHRARIRLKHRLLWAEFQESSGTGKLKGNTGRVTWCGCDCLKTPGSVNSNLKSRPRSQSPIRGCQTYFPWGPHQLHGRLQRAECHLRPVSV